MNKKVLIFTSSPRKNSNIARMAKVFAKGAEQAGHEVFYFDTADHEIKGCNACDACWSKVYRKEGNELTGSKRYKRNHIVSLTDYFIVFSHNSINNCIRGLIHLFL